MRTLTYFIAVTLDGFIAATDGSWGAFLPEGDHIQRQVALFPETIPAHLRAAMGAEGENQAFDTVLMGRATWEAGLPYGITNPYPQMRQVVFSRTLREAPDPAIAVVRDDALAAVEAMKRESGRGIWLCGGGALATALFPAIDELHLKVHPGVLGAGIPLFDGAIDATRFALAESARCESGVLFNRYVRR